MKKDLDSLEMDQLDYTQDGLLIRAEYEAAFEELYSKEKKSICRGVILTGQQGSSVSHHQH